MVVIAPVLILAILVGIALSTRRNVKRQLPWEQFRHALLSRFPDAASQLAKGASSSDLKRLTHAAPDVLPSAFLAMLEESNGASGIFFGADLLSADAILRAYKMWCEIVDQGLEDFSDDFSSTPNGAVQCLYASKGWLPFISDVAGNYIGFDFAPGPKGRKGQIICFGRDEIDKIVIARDFTEFLGLMRGILSHDQITVAPDDGTPRLPMKLSWALRYMLYPEQFRKANA